MSVAKPTATGTLGKTPLGNLLVYCLDRGLTGTLIVEFSGGRSAIRFVDGRPVKARLADGAVLLGALLVELGLVEQAALDKALAKTDQLLLGRRLIKAGALADDALGRALAEQLMRQVTHLLELPAETVYGFYEGQDYLESWAGEPIEVEPLALVWRCFDRVTSVAQADAALVQYGSTSLRLHPKSRVNRFHFEPKVRGALDVLRAKPQPLADLLGTGLADAGELKKALYCLMVTRHLHLGREGVEPIGVSGSVSHAPPPRPAGPASRAVAQSEPRAARPPRPPSARGSQPESASMPAKPPPPPRKGAPPPAPSASAKAEPSPEEVALREQIEAALSDFEQKSYYELLDVAEDCAADVVQSAYIRLAKTWHPDKLPSSLADLRDGASRVFSRINEAHQVLTDTSKRKEYDRLRQENKTQDDEQEQIRQVLHAATLFQKAEIFAKKHDYAKATELAQQAYDADPEQAEYGAFYAWVAVQADPKKSKQECEGLIRILNAAVKNERENVRIRFYRGVVLKRVGEVDKAMADFRFVADRDPRNLDAVREIRLYKMRKGELDEAKSDGLFGKLFKR